MLKYNRYSPPSKLRHKTEITDLLWETVMTAELSKMALKCWMVITRFTIGCQLEDVELTNHEIERFGRIGNDGAKRGLVELEAANLISRTNGVITITTPTDEIGLRVVEMGMGIDKKIDTKVHRQLNRRAILRKEGAK